MEDLSRMEVIQNYPWLKPILYLNRPFADSNELNINLIEQIYRGEWNDGQWKSIDNYPGGLAGAIRRELATGELVGGKSHIIKGKDIVRSIDKKLKAQRLNPDTYSNKDEKILRELRKDLINAMALYIAHILEGPYWDYYKIDSVMLIIDLIIEEPDNDNILID